MSLQARHEAGEIIAYSVEVAQEVPEVQLVTVGPEPAWIQNWERRLRQAHSRARIQHQHQASLYYLFAQGPSPEEEPAQEARPGSGIIRVVGGVPEGPGGTLTCFLSTKDGRDTYFAAAGHVVSNFWKAKAYDPNGSLDPKGAIYSYRKGFPATNSTRFFGDLGYLTHQPQKMYKWGPHPKPKVDLDLGIVKFEGEFEWIQRTTCYGTFGEWPGQAPGKAHAKDSVMKCGAEETHWTFAEVVEVDKPVWVYGPDRVYELRGQVILKDVNDPNPIDPYEESAASPALRQSPPRSPYRVILGRRWSTAIVG